MVKRGKHKIGRKTVRGMLSWSHYRFQQRLIAKAEECGVLIIHCNEAYTSKTNTLSGKIKNVGGRSRIPVTLKVGSDRLKTFIDRDVTGSRNIMIRTLRLDSSELNVQC